MSRPSRCLTAVAIWLACAGCEGEQASDGCECADGFHSGIDFEPGTAQRFVLELCTGPDCTSASYPPDPEPVESPGFFAWVRFFAGKNQLGETYALAYGKPRVKLSGGEVQTHTLSVYDADTGAVLASHTETVTYKLITVCNANTQCVRGEFSFPDAGDAGN